MNNNEHTFTSVLQEFELNDKDRAFELLEETSPEGLTFGGYGYLDDKGNLHYIEYTRDSYGNV